MSTVLRVLLLLALLAGPAAADPTVTGNGGSVIPFGGSSSSGGACGVLFASGTPVGNGADQTEDTLMTTTLKANTFNANGRTVKIWAWGTFTNNGDTKVLKVYFGAATQLNSGANNNTKWRAYIEVVRTGNNTQELGFDFMDSAGVGALNIGNAQPAQTDTSDITIKFTGQDTSASTANAVVQRGMIVEVCN